MRTVDRIGRTIMANKYCIDVLLDIDGALGSEYIMDAISKMQDTNNSLTVLRSMLDKREKEKHKHGNN